MYRLLALVVLTTIAQPAWADLVICNDTTAVQAVSVGYEEGGRPVSEGWWNIEPGECAKPIEADLDQRFYFLRAEVKGGPFDGDGHFFCTTKKAYTILGDENCADRGFDREDFMLIDVGRGTTSFTHRMSASDMDVRQSTEVGLRFCNDTDAVQSVSVGYLGADGWTSEGWWNVQPGACSLVIKDALTLDYYYFRAEVNGGEFDGEDYHFCTTPEAYTIVGATDCGSRGYDSERFREIATGGSAAYTYRITR